MERLDSCVAGMGSVQHRRVDLQSPLDLTYLHRATLAAAQQKLDQSFPPSHSDGAEDPLRRRVDELVNQVRLPVSITFDFQPSLTLASYTVRPRHMAHGHALHLHCLITRQSTVYLPHRLCWKCGSSSRRADRGGLRPV